MTMSAELNLDLSGYARLDEGQDRRWSLAFFLRPEKSERRKEVFGGRYFRVDHGDPEGEKLKTISIVLK
jgi:hypothetical protein